MLWAFWGSDKKRWENNCFLNKKNNLFPESTFVIDRIISYAQKKKIELISLDQLNTFNKADCFFFLTFQKLIIFLIKKFYEIKKFIKYYLFMKVK